MQLRGVLSRFQCVKVARVLRCLHARKALIFGSMLGVAQRLRGDEHFGASVSRRPSHDGRHLCPGRAPRLKVLSQGKAHRRLKTTRLALAMLKR